MKKIIAGLALGIGLSIAASRVRAVASPIYALTPMFATCPSQTPASMADCQGAARIILTLNADGTVAWSKPW